MILDAHWRPLQGKAIPLKDLQIKQKPKLIFFLQMPGNRVSNTLETKFFWGRPPTTPPPPPSRGFAPSALAVRAFGAQRCAPPLLRCFRRPCHGDASEDWRHETIEEVVIHVTHPTMQCTAVPSMLRNELGNLYCCRRCKPEGLEQSQPRLAHCLSCHPLSWLNVSRLIRKYLVSYSAISRVWTIIHQKGRLLKRAKG